jgi:hypothetical protein
MSFDRGIERILSVAARVAFVMVVVASATGVVFVFVFDVVSTWARSMEKTEVPSVGLSAVSLRVTVRAMSPMSRRRVAAMPSGKRKPSAAIRTASALDAISRKRDE